MILHALCDYYQRLADDPKSNVAQLGFSRQKIAFAVVIDPQGKGYKIQSVGTEKKNKRIPESRIVPGNAKPTGQGINPCFLWDNMAYMLGYKVDDKKPERTKEAFEAFRDKHLDLEKEINDEHFSLVCGFLKSWNPSDADESLAEIGTGFGLFRIRGVEGYVHERPAIKKWWLRQQKESSSEGGRQTQCLVTGEQATIARLHLPKIKGVYGAQSAGASIVSFNLDAFESYGKTQSYNAPVSERAAFQYTTGLNRLLDSDQRFQIGDTTTVFWTAKPSPMENIFGEIMTGRVEDEHLKEELHGFLRAISKGQFPTEFEDPKTDFYILGLSPNASRISIRFWYQNTLGELTKAIGAHFADLAIVHSERDPEFPSAWRLLRETARETKDISPQLAGGLMRAILDPKLNYPSALYAAILRRIRVDGRIVSVRCAILKAYLNRTNQLTRRIDMALDVERKEPAYHIGRLFAALEKTQEDALPKIKATIRVRCFGAASATPNTVFPQLIRLSQHHLRKLETGNQILHEKRFQEIFSHLDAFPSYLNLNDQGLFAIGYYHQRQDIFTKKTDSKETEKSESQPN